ncbi:MAG: tetratricopeptide repeat protein [candidate division WOR-3 bacterium]|nr:tetratricopeptide repeat protein [candidate division WOR-3 bacterium]
MSFTIRILRHLTLSLLLISCAYYNTFHNAKKFYKEAVVLQQKGSAQAKANFEKAIEKSALVISRHPRSRYVSQALFLIGMSYYHLAEYPKAIAKFENLINVFPNSKFVNQANLYWALALLENKDYNLALEKLTRLKSDKGIQFLNREEQALVTYKLAELYYRKGDYFLASQELENFRLRYKKSKYYKDALLLLGNLYREQKNFDEAIAAYKTYIKLFSESHKSERILGIIGLAECLMLTERLEEGQKILNEILNYELDSKNYLALGKFFLKINQSAQARQYLRKVKGIDAPQAYFLIASSFETEGIFDSAKIYYDSLLIKKTSSEYTKYAEIRLAVLNPLFTITKSDSQVKSDVARFDSVRAKAESLSNKYQNDSIVELIDTVENKKTGPAIDSAQIYYLLAEVYNLNLNQFVRAINEYEKVYQKFPTSPYAPKALLAIAWIYKNKLNAESDTSQFFTAYHQILNQIIRQYPETDYAKKASEMLKTLSPKK